MFHEGLRLWEVVLLTELNGLVRPGGSAKERPSRAWGEGGGKGGAWIIMSSSEVGSYEFQRSSWMQMEKCSVIPARSASDGSADNNNNHNNSNNNDNNNNNNKIKK